MKYVLVVHGGIPYFGDTSRGVWTLCCVLVPQNVPESLKDYFLVAEGVFICLPPTKRRNDEDMLKAMNDDFSACQNSSEVVLQHWRDAAIF